MRTLLPAFIVFTVLLAGCSGAPQRDNSEQTAVLAQTAGVFAMQDRAHEIAIGYFDQAIRLAPAAAVPWYQRGQALFYMDRYAAAVDSYDEALQRKPDYHDARLRRWKAFLMREQQTSAAGEQVSQEIAELISQYPDSVDALFVAYRGYGVLHDDEAQLQLLSRLVDAAKAPAVRVVVASSLAEAVIATRDRDTRLRLAQVYFVRFPEQPSMDQAATVLLHGLLREGAGGMSLDELSSLTTLDNQAWASWLRGRYLLHRGDEPDAAIENLAQAYVGMLAVVPQAETTVVDTAPLARTAYWLGVALMQAGRFDEAQARFLDAVREPGTDWRAWWPLARLYAQREDWPAAQSALANYMQHFGTAPESIALLNQIVSQLTGDITPALDQLARQAGVPRFVDVTEASGLAGLASGRLAIGDFDNDGRQDLLLDGPRLLRQTADGQFVDHTAVAGLPADLHTHGGLWADIDNDADLDVVLFSTQGNYLFENTGGHFQDITERAFGDVIEGRIEAAAWGDYDADGLLDLYLAFYEKPGVERGMCLHDQLWRNRGKRRFESVTASAGLHTDEGFCGRGVLWMDVNDDHRLDIVVANYRLDPNLLWLNEGDGQFREAAHDYGVRGNGERGAFGHSIGPAAGDLDNDAVTDLVITNLAHPRFIEFSDQTMVLLRVAGETTVFADVYAQSGIAFDETNADPSLGDVDNDGDLDIVLTSIYAGKGSHLYLNDGEAHFTDVTWLAGARVENGWGNALWDFDRDGDLDLLVASHDGVRLLRNTGLAHHWLAVDITATTCNRQGSGTRITLRQDQRVQVREIGGAKGTGTGIPQAAHFGLGADGAHVDLLLEDTCGGRYLLPDVAIDRHITVELPAAVVRQATPIPLHAQ